MSDSISALDDDYVRLGRAATLVAGDREHLAADDFMDQFKSALFAGELDPPPFYVGETRNDPSNWLHMEIEVPRGVRRHRARPRCRSGPSSCTA